MKRMECLILMFFLFWAGTPVFAEPMDQTLQQLYEDSGMGDAADALPNETLDLLRALGLEPKEASAWLDADLSELPELVWDYLRGQIKAPFTLLGALTAMLLLAVVLSGVSASDTVKIPAEVFTLVMAAGILGVPISTLLRRVYAAFQTVGGFMEGFLSAYAGILAAGGTGAAGSGMQTLTFGASVVITELMTKILLPALSVYMALCFVCAAGEIVRVDLLTKSISQAVGWVLGVSMSLFTIVLGVQRTIAQTADSLGMKTAKLAFSTFVPVVGGQLSDALTSVTTCVRLLRSTAGSFGILALTLTFLPALCNILSMLLTVKLAELEAELFRVEAAKRMFSSLSGGVGMLLGLTLCAAAALIVALTLLTTAI